MLNTGIRNRPPSCQILCKHISRLEAVHVIVCITCYVVLYIVSFVFANMQDSVAVACHIEDDRAFWRLPDLVYSAEIEGRVTAPI